MNSQLTPSADPRRSYEQWPLERAVTSRTIGAALLLFVLVGWSAHNIKLDAAAWETGRAVVALTGLTDSRVLDGASDFLKDSFPFAVASRIATDRLTELDRDNLPLFTHLETLEKRRYDALSETYTTVQVEYLVHPFGYLLKVLIKMWETIEIGFWGTLLSVLISLPLGVFASRNYSLNTVTYGIARLWLGFHRAMPELIIALFFVLMYGFGPVAGVLALAMHTSGVLGKFMADEIENAAIGPQMALRSSGANRVKVLRFAVLPAVLPAFASFVQYIFERNIRTATVLGLVGAGGIGMELKGRWDLFEYSHVSTILLVIFITVMLLEYFSQKLRGKAL